MQLGGFMHFCSHELMAMLALTPQLQYCYYYLYNALTCFKSKFRPRCNFNKV